MTRPRRQEHPARANSAVSSPSIYIGLFLTRVIRSPHVLWGKLGECSQELRTLGVNLGRYPQYPKERSAKTRTALYTSRLRSKTDAPRGDFSIFSNLRGGVMVNAAECRRQAEVYTQKSKAADTIQRATALMSIATSWTKIANQMDRLGQIEDREHLALAKARSDP